MNDAFVKYQLITSGHYNRIKTALTLSIRINIRIASMGKVSRASMGIRKQRDKGNQQ